MSQEKNGCHGVFRGVVFSGKGEGSFYVSIYAKEFWKTLGFKPYPGTLNVRLIAEDVTRFNECLNYAPRKIVNPPLIKDAKLARVIVFPIRINGISAWMVRPEITVYKEDVVEVVSDKYLRQLLGVNDGDIVYLSISYKQEG